MRQVLAFAMLGAVSIGTFASAQTASTVIASGLLSPRGMTFGPDGNLYVAEAGSGGTNTTLGQCAQVPAPIGPYQGGPTARISMISQDGSRTIVIDHLPSANPGPEGVADVKFLGGELYALIAGGGCSHGNPDFPASVIKVDRENGTYQLTADLSAWVMRHPSSVTFPPDFEPDETFYSMIPVHGRLYAVGPNHGQIVEISPDGQIRQFINLAEALQTHLVPTSIVLHDGRFQVGNLSNFPIVPGAAGVVDITRRAKLRGSIPGFTTIVGLAYHHADLYALELSTSAGDEALGTGKVVRWNPAAGVAEDVITGLNLPGGMVFGPDDALYVSDFGAALPGSAPQANGEVVRFPAALFRTE